MFERTSKYKTRLLMCHLGLLLFLVTKTQQQSCTASQFYNSNTLACENCTAPCQTCSGSATTCQSCMYEYQYLDTITNTCNYCAGGSYWDPVSQSCSTCPNSPGYCLSAAVQLSCPDPLKPNLDLQTLTCLSTCPALTLLVSYPLHPWNNNQTLTVCRGKTFYVDVSNQRGLQLGTIDFPYKSLPKAFIDIFNYYDGFSKESLKILVAANQDSRIAWGFKDNPLVIMDKKITIESYNWTKRSFAIFNSTDKKVNADIPAYLRYDIIPSTGQTYDFKTKLTKGLITDIQNSQMKDFPVTVIRGSLLMDRVDLRVDLTTVDVNQRFLNMDESDYETLQLTNSYVFIQGIFADVKNAITAKFLNNTFWLTQTNYLLTVRPSCRSDIDFTKTDFQISNNTFLNSTSVFVTYHLFFYKGFSNITYRDNILQNIVARGYAHFSGQFVSCPTLMTNNTKINFIVAGNYWNMTTGQEDGRVDLQVQETNPNITFSVKISNNTYLKVWSKQYFILVQNYNPSSYIEFNGNTFIDARIETIAITFYTETKIYLFDNYINGLYNRLRHFLYLDGPSLAHFKNMTLINAYTGLDYNAYSLILADVSDGDGMLIFESCNFTNWDIQMHYGINIAVKVQTLIINNTVFSNVKMLPLWHIVNIKETSQLVMQDVKFNNYSFQAPKSSNGFAINVINLDIDPLYPNSLIKNVTVTNMQTNFIQFINAHSDLDINSIGSLKMQNLQISNNTFDAEISLIQFNGFLLNNGFLEVEISESQFMNNNFSLYGNIIALKQNMIRPITIRNSKFQNNFGAMFDLSSGNIALTDYPTQLKVDNCTFIKNTPFSKALIVVNENCQSFIYNSYFLENYSVSRGSIIMADYQETKNYFENCTFINNSASVGGVFYTQFGSMIDCLNCTVENNFGIKGGVVYTSNDGYIRFRKSKIRWNKSLYSSILVTLSSPTAYTEFSDSLIYKNQLLQLEDFVDLTTNTVKIPKPELSYLTADYLAYLLSNTVSIQNSVQLGLIYALNSISSNLKFENLVIDSQENILSSFEASIIGSNMTIQNTIVSDTQNLLELTSTTFSMLGMNLINISCDSSTVAKDKYLMSALLRSTFNINGLVIKNTTNPIAFMLSSTLILSNSILYQLSINSVLYQPISLTDSSATMENVTMKDINVNSDSMIHLSFSTLNVTGLKMSNINQTFIQASDSNLYFLNSAFKRDSSKDPYNFKTVDLTSIEYVRSCIVAETTNILINRTNIENFITTDNGGAVSTTNCESVVVNGSYFKDNQAMMGGALYLYCDEDITCKYTIDNTTFEKNIGVTRGGAMHYNYYAPIMNLSRINFTNNIAPYGENISAYPFMLAIKNIDSVGLQVSGQIIINPIEVEVQDYYGNIINIDNTTKIELQSFNISTTQIQGASTLTVNMGKATFDEVTLISDPGRENEYLKVALQQYDNSLIGTAYGIKTPLTLNNLTVKIDFRECIIGEALQKQKCIKCPIGKFSIEETTSTCLNCPLNAQCPGGDVIKVDSGYWRARYTSSLIHECLYSPACLGGTKWIDAINQTWPTECESGYGGNLCHACVKQDGVMHTRINKHECLKCSPNQTLNILRLVGIGLCLVIALSVLIYLNLKRRGTNYLAVLMRMMTNYLQIISFAASFNLGWPESLKRLYDSISILSQSADMAFSLDCFFDNAGMDGMTSMMPTFFIKALMLLLLPVIALVIILLFWGIFGLCRKHDKETFTRNTVVSIIVVIFLAHPTLTSNAFSMMNCYEIEPEETWLQADLEIMCWNGVHKKYFFTIGLPMLIVWVIGTPLFSLILMLVNRKKLNDEIFFGKYRMLYQGLKRKHFYWEIVNTFRKISIVSINVFLALYPDYIKAIYAMLMLAIIFKAQEILQPYEIPVFNWIEQREQIASIVTFYAGLYFVKADVSEVFKYIIIVIVFFVNAWFLSLWGYMALLQLKYGWTDKIAVWVRKIICRKLKDEDMKPVDNDGLGMMSATSQNTKQSQVSKKQDEQEFDSIRSKSSRTNKGNEDRSEILDQTDNPLKNQSVLIDSKTKSQKQKTTKFKGTSDSNFGKSGSTSSNAKGSDEKSQKKSQKLEQAPSSSFSEFSDKILHDPIQDPSPKRKVKEVKDKRSTKNQNKKSKKKAKKQQSDEDSNNERETPNENTKNNQQSDSENESSRRTVSSIKKGKIDKSARQLINRDTNQKTAKDSIVQDDNNQEDSVIGIDTTQNFKTPYSNTIKDKVKEIKGNEKDKKDLKIKKPKKKAKEIIQFDSSSFVQDEDFAHTIKKKNKKPRVKKTEPSSTVVGEQVLSVSDDYNQGPKSKKLL